MTKNVANNVANEKLQDYVKKSHNMTQNEQKSEKTTQDVQKNCLSLTEQWKKGELEEGWYYIEVNEPFKEIYKTLSYYSFSTFDIDIDGNYILEVLAEVPDYIEWRNYVNGYCEEHEYNLRLQEENANLKELLKECREEIYNLIDDEPCWLDHHGYCQTHGWMSEDLCPNEGGKELLTKIDEVLK